mgnify:CR=1 FL=1
MSEDKYVTSQTLLLRARNPQDHSAWDEFIEFYKRFIYHILHKMNINANDQDDLVQDVLLKLWKGLPNYDKDKSKFRTWLSHVTRNTVLNHFRSKKSRPDLVGMEPAGLAETAYMESFSEPELEELFENEWRAYLCSIAFENIKKLFTGNAIAAFDLSQDGLRPQQIADKLGMTKESVSVLTSRVRAKFAGEVKKLINNLQF